MTLLVGASDPETLSMLNAPAGHSPSRWVPDGPRTSSPPTPTPTPTPRSRPAPYRSAASAEGAPAPAARPLPPAAAAAARQGAAPVAAAAGAPWLPAGLPSHPAPPAPPPGSRLPHGPLRPRRAPPPSWARTRKRGRPRGALWGGRRRHLREQGGERGRGAGARSLPRKCLIPPALGLLGDSISAFW